MFEKNLMVGVLLDFYGDILTERKRQILDMYYNEDFSLSEIAEQIGISRQGVREMIVKAQEELLFYEEHLGLAKKFTDAKAQLDKLTALAEAENLSIAFKKELNTLSEIIKS